MGGDEGAELFEGRHRLQRDDARVALVFGWAICA
jgi:hypothetical protein